MARVLFIVRKARSNSGRYILYCRITVNGLSKEFSLQEAIPNPGFWDQARQICHNCPEADYINTLCDKLKAQIKLTALTIPGQATPGSIMAALKAPTAKSVRLTELVQDYIKWHLDEPAKAEQKAAGTLRHYNNYLRRLQNSPFANDFAANINLDWADNFKRWLKKKTGCGITRASRHVEFYKKALQRGLGAGKIIVNNLAGYEMQRDPAKALVWLSPNEVLKLAGANFSTRLLNEINHLYLYQIATGVEYGNIWSTFEVTELPGIGKRIKGLRGKNKRPFYLPYDPMAEAILKRYNYKLPKHCNSTYNKIIKIIAEMLGINKHLTTHTARKTFAMTKLANGWPLEAIKTMLGHTSIRTTEQYYVTASPDLIESLMIKGFK